MPPNRRKPHRQTTFPRVTPPGNGPLLHRIGARSRTILSAARLDLREVIGRRRSTGDNGPRPSVTPCVTLFTSHANDRDKALKFWLQNLLDSPLIAFKWGFSRWWSVRVD